MGILAARQLASFLFMYKNCFDDEDDLSACAAL